MWVHHERNVEKARVEKKKRSRVSLVPVFLDFPIEFFRHPLELLLSVDRCDTVNSNAIGEGSFPLAMSLTEVDPLALAQWTRVSLDIPMCIAYVSGEPGVGSEKKSNRAPFPIADIRSFCKSA